MWVAKFSLKYEGDIFTERTQKFNVNYYAYPLSHYKKSGKYFFVVGGVLDGDHEKIKSFVKDLKKDKRISQIDFNGNFLTVLINYSEKEVSKSDMETFYNPSIIHLEPILNSIDGREYWTVASFEKVDLNKTIASAIKLHNGKFTSMNKTETDNLSLINLSPNISPQQKKVIFAAFEKGYYEYPRKIEIEKLAKTLGISYSTCQEHLRKAEIALLPNMLKKL